jgi:hypothetical protein
MTTHEPILTRLAALKAMSVNELKTEWQAMFDAPAPNNSRTFLESRLAVDFHLDRSRFFHREVSHL